MVFVLCKTRAEDGVEVLAGEFEVLFAAMVINGWILICKAGLKSCPIDNWHEAIALIVMVNESVDGVELVLLVEYSMFN